MRKTVVKRSLALLLVAVMLASSVLTAGAASLPVRTAKDSNPDVNAEYLVNIDFDTIPKGTSMDKMFKNAPEGFNPYGYTLTGAISGVIDKREDLMKNYLEMSVPATSGSSWHGMQLSFYQNGKSDTIGNSYDITFDFKWDGVADTSAIVDGQMFIMLAARRVKDQPSHLLWGTVSAGEINGVSTADAYFDVYAGSTKICSIQKGSGFKSFRVLYYDATQTYSVYIDNTLIVEAKAVQNYSHSNHKWTDNDLRTNSFIDYTYDSDLGVSSREEIENQYDLSFMFMRATFTSKASTPYRIGLDSIRFCELQAAEDRTVFYQNSFEGTVGNLVDGSFGGAAYSYNNTNKITVGSSEDGNRFAGVEGSGRFNIKDGYQFLQDGDYTFEFDFQATAAADRQPLFRLYDGSNTYTFIRVNGDGQIVFCDNEVPGKYAAAKNSDQWTHVAISVNVDSGNKGKVNSYATKSGNEMLRYRISGWIDGDFIGAYEYQRCEFMFEASASAGKSLDGYDLTRSVLTAEPDLSGFELMGTRTDSTSNDTLKIYSDPATGTIYQIQYSKDDGSFVAGTLNESNRTATGSVKITRSSNRTIGDCVGFFDNAKANISGYVDNIVWYEGVIPASHATEKSDSVGLVNELDSSKIIIPSNSYLKAYQNPNGGDVGVLNLNSINSGNTKISDDGSYVKISVSATDGIEPYFDLFTPNVAGKTFEAEMKIRSISLDDSTKTISLFGIRRQHAGASYVYKTLLVAKPDGTLYFDRAASDIKSYLCDANGTLLDARTSDWKTIKLIIDESGAEPTVTYMVNGNVAYFKTGTDNNAMVFKAESLRGVINSSLTSNIGAIDQRIRFFHVVKGVTFSLDFAYARCELVEPVRNPWSDSAVIDFSDYDSIDQLSDQFYRTPGVTIEDGVLKIPEGESFGWIDYNGAFLKSYKSNSTTTDGFNVEARIKTATSNTKLMYVKLDSTNSSFVYLNNGHIVVSGSLKTPQTVSSLEDEEFTDISATFSRPSTASIFANGAFVGVSGLEGTVASTIDNTVIMFPSNTEISELYIHADLKRELAAKSGDIFTMDPDIITAANNEKYGGSGILDPGPFSQFTTYTTINTDETDGSKYYRFNFPEQTGHKFSDIYLTDYIEDSAVAFEFDLRFIPNENIPQGAGSAELVYIRRTTKEDNSKNIGEGLLYITPVGHIRIHNGSELCYSTGQPIVVSQTEWQKLVAIYDANSGQVSYRYRGMTPYYKKASGEYVLADKLALSEVQKYRMDAFETRVRTVSFNNFVGTLELKNLDIYYVDESEKIEFVGVQVSNTERDIRLVAGLDMLYYGNAGFEIDVYNAAGQVISSQSKAYTTTNVYSSISETRNGVERAVFPRDYGYKYFVTATINDITANEAVKLAITPFTTTNGVRTYSPEVILDVDFTAENMTQWVCNTEYKAIRPTGDYLTGNFTTTEYIAYTNDGALELNGLNAEFAFAADCEGEVSVDLINAFGEAAANSKFDIYVDGVLVTEEPVVIPFGHHKLVLAEGLERAVHSFKIVKRSGGDFVRINTMNLCGELSAPPVLAKVGAIDVIVCEPTLGNEHGNVEVYVQTSEASGEYYIKYNFIFENKGPNNYDFYNGVGDTEHNKTLYRIKGASLVKKNADGSFGSSEFEILSSGEISLAIKEKWQDTTAKDFVGGFHGDEHIVSLDFFIDGVKLDTTKAGRYNGITYLAMNQNTVINRCDTEETDIMLHNQKYLVSSLGIKLEQQVKFLVGDSQPVGGNTFLQMATVYRINTAVKSNDDDKLVGAYANLLNANGDVNLFVDVTGDEYNWNSSLTTTTNKNLGSDKKTSNRYVEYLGNPEGEYAGLYGLVGFVIDDASVKSDSAILSIRLRQGDNKWYASFASYNGATVPQGEVWNVSNSYYFDYNPALYGSAE